jgi:hypothetical protein
VVEGATLTMELGLWSEREVKDAVRLLRNAMKGIPTKYSQVITRDNAKEPAFDTSGAFNTNIEVDSLELDLSTLNTTVSSLNPYSPERDEPIVPAPCLTEIKVLPRPARQTALTTRIAEIEVVTLEGTTELIAC